MNIALIITHTIMAVVAAIKQLIKCLDNCIQDFAATCKRDHFPGIELFNQFFAKIKFLLHIRMIKVNPLEILSQSILLQVSIYFYFCKKSANQIFDPRFLNKSQATSVSVALIVNRMTVTVAAIDEFVHQSVEEHLDCFKELITSRQHDHFLCVELLDQILIEFKVPFHIKIN